MKWNPIQEGRQTYNLDHLHPFSFDITVDGNQVNIRVTFGFHVFTDEKGTGTALQHNGEHRFFCPQRYHSSIELPGVITSRLPDSYVAAYRGKKRKEQYFYLDVTDYAIFMEVRRPNNTTNELKLNVISAYEPDQWGRSTLPKGKSVKMSYVLSKRLRGEKVLHQK